MRVGYFANRSKSSGIHVVTATDVPICRYRPAPSMQFHWLSYGSSPRLVDCASCLAVLAHRACALIECGRAKPVGRSRGRGGGRLPAR